MRRGSAWPGGRCNLLVGLLAAGCYVAHGDPPDGSADPDAAVCGSAVCGDDEQCCPACGRDGRCLPAGDSCPPVACPEMCRSSSECGASEYCAGACGAAGECAPRPAGCPGDCPGVCGCDGRTYCNGCEAAAAGVSVASERACELTSECSPSRSCGPGSFCRYADDRCGAGVASGSCTMAEPACSTVVPVCGCDGSLYDSACAAHQRGVDRGPAERCGDEAILRSCERICALAPRCAGSPIPDCEAECRASLEVCGPDGRLAIYACTTLSECDAIEACAAEVDCLR